MLRFFKSREQAAADATLLARFQELPSAAALSPLFERYVELIYGQALHYLKDAAKAEDACIDIFEHLLRKLPEQDIQNFRPWLQTVVRNHCLMQLRREKREPSQQSEELLVHSGALAHLLAGGLPEEDPRLEALKACIAALPTEQKQCVRLFYLTEGQTYLSIAEQLSLDLGKVRSFIQNGRRNLRICIEKRIKTIAI